MWWPDAHRFEAADALEPDADVLVEVNGEQWCAETARRGAVLVPNHPGDEEVYVAHLCCPDDDEGRARAGWWGTDTEAVLGAIGDRYWVHRTDGTTCFLGVVDPDDADDEEGRW